MTLTIPLRPLLIALCAFVFVAYPALVSYAIFDWRADDIQTDIEDVQTDLQKVQEDFNELRNSVNGLSRKIDNVRSEPIAPGYSQSDASSCHQGLIDTMTLVVQAQSGQISGSALQNAASDLDVSSC